MPSQPLGWGIRRAGQLRATVNKMGCGWLGWRGAFYVWGVWELLWFPSLFLQHKRHEAYIRLEAERIEGDSGGLNIANQQPASKTKIMSMSGSKTLLPFLRSLQSKSDLLCYFPNFKYILLSFFQDLPPFLAELGYFDPDFALLLFPRNGTWFTIREKPDSDSMILYCLGHDRKVCHWLDLCKVLRTLCGGLWCSLLQLYEISSAKLSCRGPAHWAWLTKKHGNNSYENVFIKWIIEL